MISKILKKGVARQYGLASTAYSSSLTSSHHSLANKLFSTRSYGNLKDQDRIFTNIYRDKEPWLKDAMKRVITTSYFIL